LHPTVKACKRKEPRDYASFKRGNAVFFLDFLGHVGIIASRKTTIKNAPKGVRLSNWLPGVAYFLEEVKIDMRLRNR
jgi:hypothetical protein